MAPKPTYPPPTPPPAIPNLTADPRQLSMAVSQYLNTFGLWVRNALSDKLPANQATGHVLLVASDPPPGTTPKVFAITVNTAGTISATVVTLGQAP